VIEVSDPATPAEVGGFPTFSEAVAVVNGLVSLARRH
jgi:hypothetical protein